MAILEHKSGGGRPTVIIVDDPLRPDRLSPVLDTALRARGLETVIVRGEKPMQKARGGKILEVVERRDGERRELLTPAQAQRYDLMVEALEAGVRETVLAEEQGQPAPTWWNDLAPLNNRERRGVRAEVKQRLAGLRKGVRA